MTFEEQIEMIDALEELYDAAADIQEQLEAVGIDIEEAFRLEEEAEEFDEGFAQMSKTKRLIARRRAGRSKKLTAGYQQANNKRYIKKASSLKKK